MREMIEQFAISWAVAYVGPSEIDKLNIFKASVVAMHRAISKLSMLPGHVIIDGKTFIKFGEIPYTCIVRGDSKYFSIAAASVLAKTYRDDYMNTLHNEYECYAWDRNKGYATSLHRKAIEKYGISPHHRRTFHLIEQQLNIDFE